MGGGRGHAYARAARLLGRGARRRLSAPTPRVRSGRCRLGRRPAASIADRRPVGRHAGGQPRVVHRARPAERVLAADHPRRVAARSRGALRRAALQTPQRGPRPDRDVRGAGGRHDPQRAPLRRERAATPGGRGAGAAQPALQRDDRPGRRRAPRGRKRAHAPRRRGIRALPCPSRDRGSGGRRALRRRRNGSRHRHRLPARHRGRGSGRERASADSLEQLLRRPPHHARPRHPQASQNGLLSSDPGSAAPGEGPGDRRPCGLRGRGACLQRRRGSTGSGVR